MDLSVGGVYSVLCTPVALHKTIHDLKGLSNGKEGGSCMVEVDLSCFRLHLRPLVHSYSKQFLKLYSAGIF